MHACAVHGGYPVPLPVNTPARDISVIPSISFSGASAILENLMKSDGTDVQSSVEEVADAIESAIEDTIENFRD